MTPLPDTNDDGTPDVGPVDEGASVDIVVAVVIPRDEPAGNNSGAFFNTVVKTVSSANDTKSDLTTDVIQSVTEAAVDLGNNGDTSDGAPAVGAFYDSPVELVASAGDAVIFPLTVKNPAAEPDTYKLTVSTVPTGWGVALYADSNGDGVLDGGERTPVDTTGRIAGSAEAYFLAEVEVPADAVYDARAIARSGNLRPL